ncbi:MAG: hypothetical protein Q3965_03135 [Rothia sp. (in: high G+C Gram-positive bacteria)]|nr:hypothetical protein [Rothia sp. (in: high G+C Gram-positive bacteria)]
MTQQRDSEEHSFKAQVRGPLIIALVLAIVAFLCTFIFATGGTNNAPQLVLSLTVAGAVFVVTLVVCATLILVEKPNDPSLSEGTGINRSSAKLYAEAKVRREAEAKRRDAEENQRLAAKIDEANAAEDQPGSK